MMKPRVVALTSILAASPVALPAQVPQIINYQGRAAVDGTNFNGTGQFKFVLVGGPVPTSLWSNNGTSANGSEPSAAVSVPVTHGLYSVALGDSSLPNMSPLPSWVFTNREVRLRTWFNDGVHGSHRLSPDQPVTSVGYAMMAAHVPDGSVTTEKLAPGAVTAGRIAFGAVSISQIASNSIDSSRLGDDIDLGSPAVDGRLDVFRTAAGSPGISLIGNSSQVSTYGSDGREQTRLWGPSWGELLLRDNTAENFTTAQLLAHETLFFGLPFPALIQSPGGALRLSLGTTNRVHLKAGTSGGQLSLYQNDGGLGVFLDGDDHGAGLLQLYRRDGTPTVTIDTDAYGEGRVTTQGLRVGGSAELSGQFDLHSPVVELKPGLIVSIDPDVPGRLVPSSTAYDKTVAGVVSGAGGVRPGLVMGPSGTASDGRHAVALTGRVYCWVDAERGTVRPGDLITTSDVPGHGMKVTDHSRAQGAVIGKAMSFLAAGRGLVLVLIALQ